MLRAQRLVEGFINLLRLRRKRAYLATFRDDAGELTPDARIVLADLAKFCRASESCFDADPHVASLLEGRREVWLRINSILNIPEADLLVLDPNKPSIDGDEYD